MTALPDADTAQTIAKAKCLTAFELFRVVWQRHINVRSMAFDQANLGPSDEIPAHVLAGSLMILIAVLFWIFSNNQNCLFIGLDGTSWILGFQAQAAREPFSQLGVDPLQGNFDSYYPALREYFLPEALALIFTGGGASKTATFTIYGLLMLAATYALARSIGFSSTVSALAGALFASLALPTDLSGSAWFYGIYNIVPHLTQVVSLTMVVVACFWKIQSDRIAIAVALIAIATGAIVISAASFITTTLFMAPTIAVYGGGSIFATRKKPDIILRCLMAASCVLIPLALGILHYAIATAGYTAFNFFSHEFIQTRASLSYASILHDNGTFGKIFWILGLLGALYAAFAETKKIKLFAQLHIIATAFFQAIAVGVVLFATDYHGPSPLYFEFFTWPIILIFAALAATKIWEACVAMLRSLFNSAAAQITLVARYVLFAIVPIALVLWNVVVLVKGTPNVCSTAGFAPIRSNAVTDILEKEIAIHPGKLFRGIEATFNGVRDKPSINWFDFHANDAKVWRSIGNDLRLVGLWQYAIPTLFQYSPVISPPYYLLLSEFLSRPSDQQLRSVIVLTVPNEPMLRLWGVRFLITDHDLGFGETRTQIADAVEPNDAVTLVEIKDVNLGNYSPTTVNHVASFRETLGFMHKPDYDGRREVLTDAPLTGPFVAASQAQLIYQKYGFTVSASSAGRSILVLPVQYSRCWSVSGEGNPILFRANAMQLGIAFTGRLDAKLVFRFGPFLASGCRIEDIRDMRRLAISDARTR